MQHFQTNPHCCSPNPDPIPQDTTSYISKSSEFFLLHASHVSAENINQYNIFTLIHGNPDSVNDIILRETPVVKLSMLMHDGLKAEVKAYTSSKSRQVVSPPQLKDFTKYQQGSPVSIIQRPGPVSCQGSSGHF